MQKFSLLLFFLFFSAQLSAQNLKKGFQFYEAKNYKKAQEIARLNIQKDKYKTPSYFLLLKCQSSIDMTGKTANIFLYFQIIEKKLNLADQNTKQEWKKDYEFDSLTYNQLKNKILNQLTDSALTNVNADLANDIITSCPSYSQVDKLTELRDSVFYERVKAENTFEAYYDFLEKYPHSVYATKAKETSDNAWMKMYWPYFREGELSSIEAFDKYYVRFPFKERIKKDIANAGLGEDLNLSKAYDSSKQVLYTKYLDEVKTDLNLVVLLKIMEPAIDKQQWEVALDTFMKYYDDVKFIPQAMNTARVIKHFPQKVSIAKWEGNVNSMANEYSPVLSANGQTLYFCSQHRKESIGGEDIFYSQKVNGLWSKIMLLNGVSTSYGNEAPESITADENTIILFSGSQGGDLEYVEKTFYKWTPPKKLDEINTLYFEGEASVSADGRVLLFVSDRTDNYGLYHKRNIAFHGSNWGNTDIYIAIKSAEGKWNKVEKLDSVINTPYAEVSPFLHPDMKTLYFCSNGHGGLGGLDVFKTTRLYDTSWVYWSAPVNLGKEINTTQDDWGYKVSTDGTFAYFARREKKQFDIYKASLPELLKPDPIGTVYGTLKLPDGKPVNGTVYWTQEGVPGFGHFTTDLEGNYSITIPQDKNYRFYLELPDVYVPPVDIQLKNNQPVFPLKFNPIPIDSIVKTETPFELKNIYFDFDKANLKPNSIEELERFLAFLNANPKIKIKITGHTDAAGTNEYNLQLSEKRAKAVAHYLISRETERSRITYEGVGEAEPDNSNKKISAFNRRVEFRIISNK